MNELDKLNEGALERKKMVALVITTYNNPKSLELCLVSLKNQSYQNFEVFIGVWGGRYG